MSRGISAKDVVIAGGLGVAGLAAYKIYKSNPAKIIGDAGNDLLSQGVDNAKNYGNVFGNIGPNQIATRISNWFKKISGRDNTTIPQPGDPTYLEPDNTPIYDPSKDTSFGGKPDPLLIGDYGSDFTETFSTSSGPRTYTGITYMNTDLTASQRRDLERSGYVRDDAGIWYKVSLQTT